MKAFRISILGGLFVASATHAQPVLQPEAPPVTVEVSSNLAQLRDEKQLAEALSSIAQDPAIHVDDAKARPLAQALMTEGVRRLQSQSYDQALANFLEAYNKLPSPKILLNIASTLRDMGRLADAANTYQRYLTDPATGADRVAEVKEILLRLDEQLTILTVRVFPRGSDLSVDGGPFVPVGSSLVTRVRAGLHLVRIRKGDATSEIPINGFEGENKDVSAIVKVELDPDKPAVTADKPPVKPARSSTSLGDKLPIETTAPETVDGWLITGTQYGAQNATSRERRVRTGYAGPELAAIVPRYETSSTNEAIVLYPDEDQIGSGVVGIMRVDGKGRGFAGGLGLAFAPQDHIEIELAGLKSDVWGAYVGARYRFLTGWLRPYAGAGMPVFFFTDGSTMKSRIAPGARVAAGIELMINGHLSVQGDLGYEHFFNLDNTPYEADVFVPTVGVIVRK
ncbi:MAG: Dihydrolipoamide acetyltransferase [Myxococcales bacterium]|nr:Dihydrolipoamide acetyltransferase [Myxococcales bacterium]